MPIRSGWAHYSSDKRIQPAPPQAGQTPVPPHRQHGEPPDRLCSKPASRPEPGSPFGSIPSPPHLRHTPFPGSSQEPPHPPHGMATGPVSPMINLHSYLYRCEPLRFAACQNKFFLTQPMLAASSTSPSSTPSARLASPSPVSSKSSKHESAEDSVCGENNGNWLIASKYQSLKSRHIPP